MPKKPAMTGNNLENSAGIDIRQLADGYPSKSKNADKRTSRCDDLKISSEVGRRTAQLGNLHFRS
jgi:hypothetical protein